MTVRNSAYNLAWSLSDLPSWLPVVLLACTLLLEAADLARDLWLHPAPAATITPDECLDLCRSAGAPVIGWNATGCSCGTPYAPREAR